MSITLDVPEDFAQRLLTQRNEAEAQLHLELAIALYRNGQMPLGRAAELAGTSQCEFEHVLCQRQIPMPYTEIDLEHDLAYASGCR